MAESNSDENPLFNIEAFIRSEGVSADLIVLDAIILNADIENHQKAAKINELVGNIKKRNNS